MHLKNTNSNIRQQKAIIKYGINNFEYGILEYIKTYDREELLNLEQLYLDKIFKDDYPSSLRYNIANKSSGGIGEISEETRMLISNKKKEDNL